MRILVAEDDPTSRRLLQVLLSRTGHEVQTASNGHDAWEILEAPDPPKLVILDWMMPGRDGIEICRELRRQERSYYIYLILVTTKTRAEDIVAGLEAGADDYLTKPYDPHELSCRVANGERVLKLESQLADKIDQLEEALAHVKQLQGLLPICMYCKKIRNDEDTWLRLETYFERYSGAVFSHSLCEECRHEHYPDTVKTASG